ncbi:MAG: hypothetical protein JXQ84_00515 [Rhodospirillaceae bacterium]|nr:hypothetical protein [Rhodospirillaceae bacterium]
MKLAIGYHIQDGPWGGGNNFARSLAEAATARGDHVVFDLADDDIDLILLTDPRAHSPSVSFGPGAILRYLISRNRRAIVVHRINECDERKGTHNMNHLLWRGNYAADHTVFIASWLRDLAVYQKDTASTVILNGGDTRLFHPGSNPSWNGTEPLRFVTHHWGGNRLKGFDVYEALDRMLAEPEWKGRIDFTYIGNLPQGFAFANAHHVTPLSGPPLVKELTRHHAYITGSINEPAGMHHVEGALCGLPLLYRKSGALPEYCASFGFGFNSADEVPALIHRMMSEYSGLRAAMANYQNTAERMSAEYLRLFDSLLADREAVLARRRLWRNPWLVLRNQIPF